MSDPRPQRSKDLPIYRILVIVPFPMAEEQLALRRAQAAKAGLPPGVELVFRPVRAAPANYSSAADSALPRSASSLPAPRRGMTGSMPSASTR
jgi:hypothetical protein